MSDPMLVNRVRHPLRPIAPGAAVNPYLTHTDLSLNPANWFNRRRERKTLIEYSEDPLKLQKILMASRERVLLYQEEIDRLVRQLEQAMTHYNKHVARYSEEKEDLKKDAGPAIGKAMNYYHGEGAEEKNEKRKKELEELKERVYDIPEALKTIEIGVLDGLETIMEDLDDDFSRNYDILPGSPGSAGEGERARHYDGGISGHHTPNLSASGSEEDDAEWDRSDCP